MGFSKECTKCGRVKWWYQFGVRKNSYAFSLRSNCKSCACKYSKKYRKGVAFLTRQTDEKYRQRLKEKKRDWYQKNKERISKEQRIYRNIKTNKERIAKYQKEYQKKNKQKLVACAKQYYQENKELCVKCRKKYRQENKESLSEYAKKWRKENAERLTDRYIIRGIMAVARWHNCEINPEDIPPELIELKRRALKTYRLIKLAK